MSAAAARGPKTAIPLGAAAMGFLAGLSDAPLAERPEPPSTRRIAALLAALGDPHRTYPVVHVTGTNGKGSTAAMTAALLRGAGLRVGTCTSPHVERLNERVTVDGELVGDEALAEAIGAVAWAAEGTAVIPSWFEAVTAAGLWLLAVRAVDVAVVEVGMLGRWDATNVCDGAVAVVTNVELDHTEMAGPTRAAIAAEKAGIVKPGATLILGERDPALRSLFAAQEPARILTLGSELSWQHQRPAGRGSLVDLVTPFGAVRREVPVGMAGEHQCSNAVLALAAAEALLATIRPDTTVAAALPDATVAASLHDVRLPGRFEVVHRHPTVVLDGAHNPAGAAALRAAVASRYGEDTRRVVLCGALTGRDPVAFLDALGVGPDDLVVATMPPSARALAADVLAAAARSVGTQATVAADAAEAWEAAVAAADVDDIVIATGSLHLIAAVRAAARRATASARTADPAGRRSSACRAPCPPGPPRRAPRGCSARTRRR